MSYRGHNTLSNFIFTNIFLYKLCNILRKGLNLYGIVMNNN